MGTPVTAHYEQLLDLILSFWRSQVVMAAVEMHLFSALGEGPLPLQELTVRTGIQPRGATELVETLVACGLLERDGDRYANSPMASCLLDRRSPSYVGSLCSFTADRLYPVWHRLCLGLRSGCPQNEAQGEGDYYASLSQDGDRHLRFLTAMEAMTAGIAEELCTSFPWERYATFVDAGGGRGGLAATLVRRHPHLTGTNLDLPSVEPYFRDHFIGSDVETRLHFHGADFFRDQLPPADVIVMGNVLHNWSDEQKHVLVRKAWSSLPTGGALIVYEWFWDRHGAANPLGLMMSLNMLLVTAQGSGSSTKACQQLLRDAGFGLTEVHPLCAPWSMVIGWKSRRP